MVGLTAEATSPDSLFGKSSSPCICKSEPVQGSANTSPLNPCPHCGSSSLYRDGLRYLADGGCSQRWLCRDCGFRFSEKPLQKNQEWSINTETDIVSKRQICVDNNKETKNLTSATELKTVAGDIKKKTFATTRNIDVISEEARGLITEFMAHLEREGFDDENQYPNTLSHLAKDGANLLDPEDVKTVIAKQKKKNGEPWSDSMKMLACCAYDAFCAMKEIRWSRPPTVRTKPQSMFLMRKTWIC